MIPSPEANVLFTHFTAAALAVVLMNWLKAQKWFPLVQKDRAILNRIFSAGVALAVTVGITYTWSSTTGGGHQVVIVIPSIAVLGHNLWHWVGQYMMQEGYFHATKGPEPPKP